MRPFNRPPPTMLSPLTTRLAFQRYLESAASCEIAYRDERQRSEAGRVNAMLTCHGASGVAKTTALKSRGFWSAYFHLSAHSLRAHPLRAHPLKTGPP